ncbi:MAG: hypothetical protein ACFBSC_00595 [Microcoleaceae cyanobacterium]
MSFQDDQDVKRRLEDLEAEINQQPVARSTQSSSKTVKVYYQQFLSWFKDLPTAGQIVVGILGVFAGLALLKLVIQLISLAFSLAIVGGLGYIAYQIFKQTRSSKS